MVSDSVGKTGVSAGKTTQSGNKTIPGGQDRLGSSFLPTLMVIQDLQLLWGGCQVGIFEIFDVLSLLCRATEWFQKDLGVGVAMQRTCLTPHLQKSEIQKTPRVLVSPMPAPHSILFSSWLSIIPKPGIIPSPDRLERQEGQKTLQELRGSLRLDLSRK